MRIGKNIAKWINRVTGVATLVVMSVCTALVVAMCNDPSADRTRIVRDWFHPAQNWYLHEIIALLLPTLVISVIVATAVKVFGDKD